MATLDWIGKKAVVNHHREVPYHLLKEVPELSCGAADSGNLIVEGDNLVALKALLPYYAGKVKCIYIDPPYNTGNEGWTYNDNVNSPEIQNWLGETVGKESDDLSRHDKWLCMMYPRLELLKRFLEPEGIFFVSIDDAELANLITILDEIFGANRRLCVFTWVRKKKGSNLSKQFRKITEYIVVYKNTTKKVELRGVSAYSEKAVPLLNRANNLTKLRFPEGSLEIGNGFKTLRHTPGIKAPNKGELAVELHTEFLIEDKKVANDIEMTGRWRWAQDTVDYELENGSRFVLSKDFRINVYRFNQSEKFKAPESLLTPDDGIGTNEDATEELRNLFPEYQNLPFDYPKPSSLVKFLIEAAVGKSKYALVLDSFAGSGTTGHAVTRLNQDGNSSLQYILCQMPFETEEQKEKNFNICEKVTRERMRRVAESKSCDGPGFKYVRLDAPLYGETGCINEAVKYPDLARHVFFIETGEPLPKDSPLKDPLLGVSNGKAVYLLYNGILKDKSVEGGNRLTRKVLESLPPHEGPKVVYGTACQLGPELLKRHNLTFKQIPYSIQTS